jgi:hypothetical protein
MISFTNFAFALCGVICAIYLLNVHEQRIKKIEASIRRK